MRLFVSILVPDHIRSELIRIQKELRAADIFEGTYVKPENIHSTIFFFGSVDDTLVPLIGAQLATINSPTATITLDNLGVNSLSHPHVLWVSLESTDLALLAQKLEEAFPDFKQDRSFNGHITLARLKKVRKDVLKQALGEITVPPLSWVTNEYALQVSQTLPEGPVYTTLGTYKLGK